MLSPGVLRMLDQVRSEFGVEVEIVDANLAGAWSPDGQRQSRVLTGPELRLVGQGVLREGRSSVVSVDGREYRLVPLRNNRSVLPTALLAMRVGSTQAGASERQAADVEPWVEVLRGAIEADLTSREEIDGERQQARAVRGALRFVTYLASAKTERELAEAAIQAAAVWFDADARVYRRRPGGDYALFASLPGAQVPIEGRQLTGLDLGLDDHVVRTAHFAGNTGGGRDGIVVPIAADGPAEWALVLLGSVPGDAEVTLEALGRVLGVQMERLALGRTESTRERFQEIVVRAERAVELTAMDVLRDLVGQTFGSGAALWVMHGDAVRRMAAVGEAMNQGERVMPDQRSGATLQVRTISIGENRTARLELRTTADAPFDSGVPEVVDACASVLKGWLAAAVRPEPRTAPLVLPDSATAVDFARRIEEELARAKRFDRDLAVVVVDPTGRGWPANATSRVVDVLREELRGSDVLGLVGERRVVVLLIETHKSAMGTVVRRLRDRLGRAIPELKLPALVLGQAAFSRECATADALLSEAAVNAETISVPA